ncbi:protein FdhE [Burkholderia sp. SFA1]|uniref:formate dehydrogenase accessory protein FdhE n=1 Tax=unclassified Caballeronia TaxID=2646786 RepID=UPI001F2137BA|nr:MULTISPECIES: formate dehydrogenase accessory protein FdhE [unclassified Caballeronia]MCE4543871.1 formate dehydrogenase accessory protein FdhE [Caballeronia sp. PC1]MCE4571024.1 formate dehydrogenase accessory protein FdhE [Caballeronia sp. CLC5]BBP99133.1 protein FdhE [Burkholderia sp. SFA1]
MVQRIVEAARIESLDPSAIPRLRMPERATVFAARAARLLQLADASNPIAGYLRLMAALADAQQRVLAQFTAPMPSRESIELNQRHSMPIVPALTDSRGPAWRDVLFMLLDSIESAGALTPALVQLVARLRALDARTLDNQADAVLALRFAEIDPAAAPFIAAALQVVWTDLASRIDAKDVPYLDAPGVCPVCGSVPVASIVRVGGAYDGYRYAQCGLCATELHVVRAKCTNCDSTKGIAYHAMGSGDESEEAKAAKAKSAPLKAESCDECGTYRKIGYQDKAYDFEPYADDLASLTLDLLMGDAGYRRAAPHPWLWPEQTEEER